MKNSDRWLCDDCGAVTATEALLVAPNPFDSDDICHGCPACRGIDQFVRACDFCDERSCTGGMTPSGYAYLCADHDDMFLESLK